MAAIAFALCGAPQPRADNLPVAHVAPLRPGIGAHDPRVRVDPDIMPWRAVGKLRGISGGLVVNCTGTLVGPALVLTAAHCVVNPKTRRYFPPRALHFLLAYDSGTFAGHAVATRLTVSAAYDPAAAGTTLGSDWALLTLDEPLGTPDRVLAIEPIPPAPGTPVAIGGYSQDHARLLLADETCRVVDFAVDRRGYRLLRHNCTGTNGTSGAPLLLQEHGAWRVGAVQVAAKRGAAGGIAVLLDEVREKL
jgi:protease YdgD